MTSERSLSGKRVHVAGSISPQTSSGLATYAHDVVRRVVRGVLEAGGGIVVGPGKEPKLEGGPAQLFDWTVLEVAAQSIRQGICQRPAGKDCPIVAVVSEKGESEIPYARRALWSELLESGTVEVRRIMPGARSAAMIRNQQVGYGDVLFILGGGTGVEHLAEEYRRACKPVIPLDLALGASREDGTGGSERLARESRANPMAFIRLRKDEAGREGAKLARIATDGGRAEARVVAEGVLDIIANLAPPTVFYVRLLNQEHDAYERVERFFRNVVDPLVAEVGLNRVDLSRDEMESGFINTEIFRRLHHCTVAVVDVTAERSNCFIELGYALGRPLRVICTAERGTKLPFDQSAVPCYFWQDDEPDEKKTAALRAFWEQYINRAPIVP
ncbi:MAG: hypothetical protein ACREVK_08765 [Gammaproteobacteria bacterium]